MVHLVVFTSVARWKGVAIFARGAAFYMNVAPPPKAMLDSGMLTLHNTCTHITAPTLPPSPHTPSHLCVYYLPPPHLICVSITYSTSSDMHFSSYPHITTTFTPPPSSSLQSPHCHPVTLPLPHYPSTPLHCHITIPLHHLPSIPHPIPPHLHTSTPPPLHRALCGPLWSH